MRLARKLLLAIPVSAALAAGQTPSPTAHRGFEVVSIRPAAPDAPDTFVMRQLGRGVVDLQRYPLTLIIQSALHAKPFEITGLPSWVASARYDIHAKTAEPATALEMWPMLLPVLEERFKMQMHREEREKPVYELSVSKSGKLLTVPDANCWDPRGPMPAPVRVALGQRPFLACDSTLVQNTRPAAKLWGTKIRMPTLISALQDLLGRPVLDKTGFMGTFDLALTFARDDSVVSLPPSAEQTDPSGVPSIFTTLQEQLGLKLASAKDPVEVIVIDRIERPSDN